MAGAPRCDECRFMRRTDWYRLCVRRAPRVGESEEAVWPRVKADDRCGEFEPALTVTIGARFESETRDGV